MKRVLPMPMSPLRRSSNSRRTVVGLDIEPGAVHAAEVSVNGHLVVERAASAALEPGVVRDGEVVDPEALTRVLRDLFTEHKLDKHVRIGVANQRIVVRVLELPPISDAKELEVAVRFQAADQVPMPLDQAVLEHVVLGIVETPEGPRMRVLIVAARRDMIERLLKAVQDAGLRPEGVDLSGFAMVRALGSASAAPVLHLSVGGVVNLAVAQGGQCVFTRVVGGGLEAMAIELAERREITVEEARADLQTTGLPISQGIEAASRGLSSDEDPEVSQTRLVLSDGVRRIAAEVRNSVDFHLGADQAVERVLLTGTAASVPGVAEALTAALGLPVEVAAVQMPDGMDSGPFAVAAGLAIEERV
jgi:type IV pilus assembly protein PilM